jgi:hypothetical protein
MSNVVTSGSTIRARVKFKPTFRNRIYGFISTIHFEGVEAGLAHYYHRALHKLTGNTEYEPNVSDERFAAGDRDASLEELIIESPSAEWGLPYEPWPEELFEKAVQSLPVRLDDYSFIDFGAGKGLALLLAANYPFKSITGVEYSKTLADTAAANIQSFRERSGSKRPLNCIWGDAADFKLPIEPTILYLFNPFQGKVMDRVIANIEKSLQNAPRDFWVIYGNPWEVRKFRRSPALETIEWNAKYSLHRSIRP